MNRFKGKQHITSLELQDEPWSFYLVTVERDEKGFYLATDSGCSCPTPFENHTNDDLTGPLTLDGAVEEVVGLWTAAGRKVPMGIVLDVLNDMLVSFLEGLDTRWIIADRFDLPLAEDASCRDLYVVDATGERYNPHYDDDKGWYEWVSATVEDHNEGTIVYPAEVIENEKM